MPFSEIIQKFDKNRPELKPYGMTCNLWTPSIMDKPDRHNEIELNFFPKGSITYLVNDQKIKIPEKRLILFWALVPHQIIGFEENSYYYVCTIPLRQFMEWNFPNSFVNRLIEGEIQIPNSEVAWEYDHYIFQNWVKDFKSGDHQREEIATLEIQGRLKRFALESGNIEEQHSQIKNINQSAISSVEKMAIFIAKNYSDPITTPDIAASIGLHPDYANTIFKKAFGTTLNKYVIKQRVLNAQRRLSVTREKITSIAYESGFNSIGRFNAAFKLICNCTPREYRKKYQE
ncbi:MAG: helix-turn-helix domain-containing protein [Flammeovirgaceae bacterium]|nr:helix-turn-helix domain-containing protein [Flammeovirgaceae bacterium]